MPTDVVMPQMGESIFEGTITKWLKKPGDKVSRDEPLFEISTDKVDAEIPSPTAGVLKEIKVPEGTTVQVNTVVGTIAAEGEAAGAPAAATPAAAPQPQAAAPQPQAAAPAAAKPEAAPRRRHPRNPRQRRARRSPRNPPRRQPPAKRRKTSPRSCNFRTGRAKKANGYGRRRWCAASRAKTTSISNQVEGTGLGGRITKEDIVRFVEQRRANARRRARSRRQPARRRRISPEPRPRRCPSQQPIAVPGEVVPMSAMRKKIAERMVQSKRTSAHVHSVFEVDLSRVMAIRQREKASFEQRTGTRLTMMPFFCRAAIEGIRNWPIINASVEGDNLHYHRNVNLGIAVALDWGLIVPVIKRAEDLNFLGIQRAIIDLAERARNKKLLPDEVAGGTFTVTNPGSYGQMFGLPIIMQPQVAILGVGSIKKQPVVVSDENGGDSIAIRSICHIILGYDHRVVDGAVGDQFLRDVAKYLENWNEPVG